MNGPLFKRSNAGLCTHMYTDKKDSGSYQKLPEMNLDNCTAVGMMLHLHWLMISHYFRSSEKAAALVKITSPSTLSSCHSFGEGFQKVILNMRVCQKKVLVYF